MVEDRLLSKVVDILGLKSAKLVSMGDNKANKITQTQKNTKREKRFDDPHFVFRKESSFEPGSNSLKISTGLLKRVIYLAQKGDLL